MQAKQKEESNTNKDPLVKAISENIDSIKNVNKKIVLLLKVANMTTANLTGTAPRTYNFILLNLSQKVNIEDFVGSVSAPNGIYTYTVEELVKDLLEHTHKGKTKTRETMTSLLDVLDLSLVLLVILRKCEITFRI